MIKRAIQHRACLSGTHTEFRVRFAPHVLGRDENGRHIVLAFEYGGQTLIGSLESRPQVDLKGIEAAV